VQGATVIRISSGELSGVAERIRTSGVWIRRTIRVPNYVVVINDNTPTISWVCAHGANKDAEDFIAWIGKISGLPE